MSTASLCSKTNNAEVSMKKTTPFVAINATTRKAYPENKILAFLFNRGNNATMPSYILNHRVSDVGLQEGGLS